jgi:hypothetical protein
MITLPSLAAEALGSFLAHDMRDRFGHSHARLAEIVPFAARLALECIGNSDALYHNVEHTMLVSPTRRRMTTRTSSSPASRTTSAMSAASSKGTDPTAMLSTPLVTR